MSFLGISHGVTLMHEYRHSGPRPARAKESVNAGVEPRLNFHPCRKEQQGGFSTVADTSSLLTKLLEMFTQFFAQLQSLLPDNGAKVTPDVMPAPQPTVVPEPGVPLPSTRVGHLPDLSSKRNGAKADDIWGGFRQGPDGNCVTVSAIKAAMEKFGQSPTDIYKYVQKLADGYRVTMRDGFELTLNRKELTEGIRGAKFVGRDKEMLKDAHFLFAVSAKRAQMENNDGRASRSFSAAVKSLNDGEDERGAGEGFLRLGLKRHMKKVPVSELAKGTLGMVNRAAHSVAVINGIEELYGRKGKAPTRGDAIALV